MLRALRAELAKLKRSPVPVWSALIVAFWPLVTIGIARITGGSWRDLTFDAFMSMAPQSIASWFGVILGGFVTAYMFGREYGDATIRTVLTLPVRREWFVISKVIVLLAWMFGLATLSVGVHLIIAAALRLDGFAWTYVVDSLRNCLVVTAVIVATLPFVGWLAVIGRGYLAPMIFSAVAFTSGTLFLQGDWVRWWPWSMPFAIQGIVWVPGDFRSKLVAGSWLVLATLFAGGITALVIHIDFTDNLE